ncbi:MAG: hypothetical protein R3E75_04835 [Steroidobacteraceae bacterium]|nr:hypothetical protein [Nevskiaceae bacterium]MCP5471433.1 hypothetical protein [Nevskiaceae bacterium]
MLAVLTMGFLLGMRHALDPDHLIAVTVLGTQSEARTGSLMRHALAWGFGHSAMLLALAALIVLSQGQISPGLSSILQALAAGMLVAIGAATLWRLRSAPSPAATTIRTHAHAHAMAAPAAGSAGRDSQHLGRTLLIGLTQGLAGSAALLVVAVSAMREPALSILYVLLFGVGSMTGMVALAATLTLPLARVAARSERLYRALSLLAGLFAVVLGLATLATLA